MGGSRTPQKRNNANSGSATTGHFNDADATRSENTDGLSADQVIAETSTETGAEDSNPGNTDADASKDFGGGNTEGPDNV
ncbi:hypothetical protein [Cnuella takakiae]|uniref:hypothetical protein n=1 Tax=Cnuella takakiae TaxID=1302690 RepID=UPI001570155F|nr:hypothetical protein [Cnuella takakiae]